MAFAKGREFVLYGTSFIGSYTFMRGWTFLLGSDYPSEDDIYRKVAEGAPVEFSITFCIYIAIFAVLFILTS